MMLSRFRFLHRKGITSSECRFLQVKVTAPIRIGIRRRIIRVDVRQPIVRSIIPIATESNRADNVRIDEVRSAPAIPFIKQELFLIYTTDFNFQKQGRRGRRPLLHHPPLLGKAKVTAPIRIGIRRRIRRVDVRQPSVRSIRPIATESNRADNGRIDEGRIITIIL